jgi:acyl-CoA thioester hydrolase
MPSEFEYTYRVTYRDCTVGNHVYYSRYLDLLEGARGELFRQSGVTLQEWQGRGFIFPVVECRLRYKHPARYDDLLAVRVWVTRAEGIRLHFGNRILNQGGVVILEGETHHVCTSLTDKLIRVPSELRSRFEPWLREAPADGAVAGDRGAAGQGGLGLR